MQATGVIEITIIDDTVVEFLETFTVTLIRVTGSASLGDDTTVTIFIPPNDSPVGVFGFEEKTVSFIYDVVPCKSTKIHLRMSALQWKVACTAQAHLC